MERTLKSLQQEVLLLCRVIDFDDYQKLHSASNGSYKDLPKESILRQCGYCVNMNVNLSNEEREHILCYVIKSGILTKDSVLGHLSWLIGQNEWRTSFQAAVDKWKHDYKYVTNLDIDNLPKINIIEIRRKVSSNGKRNAFFY